MAAQGIVKARVGPTAVSIGPSHPARLLKKRIYWSPSNAGDSCPPGPATASQSGVWSQFPL